MNDCNGQFCSLRHYLVLKGFSVHQTDSKGGNNVKQHKYRQKNYNQFVLERESRKRNERDAALILLRKIVHPKEWELLEEEGHLSVFSLNLNRFYASRYFGVDERCLELAKQEHRLDFCQAVIADDDIDYIAEHNTKHENYYKNESDDTGCVDICGACFEVYQILDQLRRCTGKKTSQNSTSLDDFMDKSILSLVDQRKQTGLKVYSERSPLQNNAVTEEKESCALQTVAKTSKSNEVKCSTMATVREQLSPTNIKEDGLEHKQDKILNRILVYGKDKNFLHSTRLSLAASGFLTESLLSDSQNKCISTLEKSQFKSVIACLGDKNDTMNVIDVLKWYRKIHAIGVNEKLPFILLFYNNWEGDDESIRHILRFKVQGQLSQEDISHKLVRILQGKNEPKGDRIVCNEVPAKTESRAKLNSYPRKELKSNKIFSPKKNDVDKSDHGSVSRSGTGECKGKARFTGTVFFDSDTSFPFTVINPASMEMTKVKPLTFNLIVCQDLFETQERIEHILRPLTSRYPQMQVLLWNYPGQAYTKYRSEENLNNVFHAACFEKLLEVVTSLSVFDVSRPCYLMGIGSGAMVALYYVASSNLNLNIRSILLLNGLLFLEQQYTALIHDCRNVFRCSPSDRPDLPLYFYCRFIFSPQYLKKTGAPLAMNLYSAVYNPLPIKGRIQLCNGVLNNVEILSKVKNSMSIPIIAVYGKDCSLIRPVHSQRLLDCFNKSDYRFTSIYSLLNRRFNHSRAIVLSIDGGHELFQESKNLMLKLIEQLITGYHEKFDVPVLIKNSRSVSGERKSPIHILPRDTLEDRYINAVMTNQNTNKSPPLKHINSSNEKPPVDDRENCIDKKFEPVLVTKEKVNSPKTKRKHEPLTRKTQYNYGDYPEVKEYIAWRSRRNKRRLVRLERAAVDIQRAFRVFLAKTVVQLARQQKAAQLLQRVHRGVRGRKSFMKKRHELWAVFLVQRILRGFIGRSRSHRRRVLASAQEYISKMWRGHLCRLKFKTLVSNRLYSAVLLQCFWRRRMALRYIVLLRYQRNASISIQRFYRGHLGRRKAENERDKFIFSRSKMRGIEYGRQLLVEHKLQATKLQSEVSLLNKEKERHIKVIDELLDEINGFEKVVLNLEESMQKVCRLESSSFNSRNMMEIENEKRRLDEEFAIMLAKISDRRERLEEMEGKLSKIERDREIKDTEVRALERKLVILLETQQIELHEIKKAQDKRFGVTQLGYPTTDAPISTAQFIGPSIQQKEEASKLLDSTEAMMKFGFMSMSMSYFSSLNMFKAIKTMGSVETLSETNVSNRIDSSAPINCISKHRKGSPAERWDIDDVIEWLDKVIRLKQYETMFRDGAVDGSFLLALTDEDLRYSLGVEHKLHRKKILLHINQLKHTSKDLQSMNNGKINEEILNTGNSFASSTVPTTNGAESGLNRDQTFSMVSAIPESPRREREYMSPKKFNDLDLNEHVPLEELFSWARHNHNYEKFKQALDKAFKQDKLFDKMDIRAQYVEDMGTIYTDIYNQDKLNINATDEHGNTLLHVAAQNGNLRSARLLLQKGAYVNHQNRQGQTAAHFAMAYNFFDFGSWLFDKGGADDTIMNVYGLTPYDGLEET